MQIKIKSKKTPNKFIYGNLRISDNRYPLIIFLSGFYGGMDFNLFEKAEGKFSDTFRFDFCKKQSDGNKKYTFEISNFDFDLYTEELKNVIDHLRKNYRCKKIVLIGHNFGTIISTLFLNKNPNYKKDIKLILWEPALLPLKKDCMSFFTLDKNSGLYFDKRNKNKINKKLYEKMFNIKNTAEIFGNLKTSSLIIATKGGEEKNAIKYFKEIKNKKDSELFILEKTKELLKDRTAVKNLFQKTKEYLAKTQSFTLPTKRLNDRKA